MEDRILFEAFQNGFNEELEKNASDVGVALRLLGEAIKESVPAGAKAAGRAVKGAIGSTVSKAKAAPAGGAPATDAGGDDLPF